MNKCILGILLLITAFSCRRTHNASPQPNPVTPSDTDSLKKTYTIEMAGDYAWLGTKFLFGRAGNAPDTIFDVSFHCSILVLNDSTVTLYPTSSPIYTYPDTLRYISLRQNNIIVFSYNKITPFPVNEVYHDTLKYDYVLKTIIYYQYSNTDALHGHELNVHAQ